MKTCCQKTRIKYNVKKMQQRKKSKHRSLMTKTLIIRTLKIRGISAVNHQKNNGLTEIKAVGKAKYTEYLNEMNDPIVLEPELKPS